MTWNPTAFREHSFQRTVWAFPSPGRVSPRYYPSISEVSSVRRIAVCRCYCFEPLGSYDTKANGLFLREWHRAPSFNSSSLYSVLIFSGLGS
ncbi:hypothetical protein CORC01_03486 [Colletotrichum orchidophilum]|uniref:Uncharacterized protein n=1 Tax=Colletotrichum orchidophilum TaxID=1209926 RepID=A0A1G4BIB5_9PEZI|nr:uncharacterized protein CORC01_03486 [Colletotrichum orchidophilum]OHF01172.1 hypothetical protein CORC01_03486 [Colletotrichum orchidophilum]